MVSKIFFNFKKWWPVIGIVGLGIGVYLGTLGYDLTYLDDNAFILDQGHFLANLANLPKLFKHDLFFLAQGGAYYRPIMALSLMIDANIGGGNLFYYHLSNLIFHLVSSILVYLVLRQLSYRTLPAFLAASVFAIHPSLVQAVAWVPGRNDSLFAIFGLLSFLALTRTINSNRWSTWAYLIAHLGFFTLAIFTKETAIALIIIFLVYIYLIAKSRPKLTTLWLLLLGWATAAILWLSLRNLALPQAIDYSAQSIIQSMLHNVPVIIQYLGKVFLPIHLSVLPIKQDTTYFFGLISIIFLGISLFYSRHKRKPFLVLGAIWYLILILPVLVYPDPQAVVHFYEHRLYLPIIGLLIMSLEIDWVNELNPRKTHHWLVVSTILVTLIVRNLAHATHFRDRASFWLSAVQTSPHSPLAHRNLGAIFYLDGNLVDAEREFRKSLELNPTEPMAHNNLGLIYARQGLVDQAEQAYQTEISLNQTYGDSYFNLGLLYYSQGKTKAAAELWQKTLAVNPNYDAAYVNLTVLYYEQKDFAGAKAYLSALQERGFKIPTQLLTLPELANH